MVNNGKNSIQAHEVAHNACAREVSVTPMSRDVENIVKHSDQSEKVIERHLVKRCHELGGECLKYNNPAQTGYPDRLCLFPYGRTVWVELKSKGKKPTKEQQLRHRRLDSLGFPVHVCDSKTQVDNMLRDLGYEI